MDERLGKAARPGEYDAAMQVLLQVVWGEGFLSPGGPDEIARLLEGTELAGRRVLDIGCGLGAVDVLLARTHGAGRVVGIDLEADFVEKATRRVAAAGLSDRVQFVRVAPGPLPFPQGSFDVVFSKDSLVQIPDKPALFAQIRRVLRPGGAFVASDWLRGGSGAYSAEMLEYFRLEEITYNMASIEDTVAGLEGAGFEHVKVTDRSEWYRALAVRERDSLSKEWYPMIEQRIGTERARHFVDCWRQLVVVLERGELRPAHLRAVNPAA